MKVPHDFTITDKALKAIVDLNFKLHCTVQVLGMRDCVVYCTVLYCTVLYCTVLYCTVLYCTVLCCACVGAGDTGELSGEE